MNFAQVKHALYKALGTRDALYLDTNAWSAMAKGHADPTAVADWLARTNSVIAITRFSIGELAKDDRLAENLAELIESLNVIFVDLGTKDLDGQHWQQVPYDKIMSLKPADADAKSALVELLRSEQIQDTMNAIRSDAATWQTRFEQINRKIAKNRDRQIILLIQTEIENVGVPNDDHQEGRLWPGFHA